MPLIASIIFGVKPFLSSRSSIWLGSLTVMMRSVRPRPALSAVVRLGHHGDVFGDAGHAARLDDAELAHAGRIGRVGERRRSAGLPPSPKKFSSVWRT